MKMPPAARREKTCKECKITYVGNDIEIAFFKRKGDLRNNYFSKCRLCEQDARTEKSKTNRWRGKAARTRQYHARKFSLTTEQLEKDHGWNLNVMAHHFRRAYENGCIECGEMYSAMDGGHGDLTLDIWDRRIEPGYSNTRIMCKTCNLAKGTMTPEEWTMYKRLWRQRERIFVEREGKPRIVQLSLFSYS